MASTSIRRPRPELRCTSQVVVNAAPEHHLQPGTWVRSLVEGESMLARRFSILIRAFARTLWK